MSQLHMTARMAARKALPNREWFPIEAWDDERYDREFSRMRAQPVELEAQRRAAANANGPLFSIVVPLFQTPHDYLLDMAESVLAQTYPLFELILVNASPELPELRNWIGELAERDSRVKTVLLDGNHGITENTNQGIAAATGDFVCFMDHDDWLEPDALFEFAAALAAQPDIDLMYCDEDLVEKVKGVRHYRHPLFKPDFSPELLLCKNFVVHLLTVRKSLIEQLPTPSREHDGAQDYNMTFLACERARAICHVPRVLYHWRMSENSTAANSGAKPYGKRAYRLSAQMHLDRTATKAHMIGTGIVNIHNIWFTPDNREKVSLIIAHDDAHESFGAFVEAFNQVNTYKNVELVLVGEIDDESASILDSCDLSVVACNAPANASPFARFNVGARNATGNILAFFDSGCILTSPQPIEQLVGLLDREGVGIAAPKVFYLDYSVKQYGIGVSAEGVVPLYRAYPPDYPSYQCNMRAFQNTSATGYQGMTMKRRVFDDVGGFDEVFSSEIASVDLCQRVIKAGFRIVAACTVELLTAEEPPIKRFADDAQPDFPAEEAGLLFTKIPELRTATDPYRNPNLDLRSSYPIIDYRRIGR